MTENKFPYIQFFTRSIYTVLSDNSYRWFPPPLICNGFVWYGTIYSDDSFRIGGFLHALAQGCTRTFCELYLNNYWVTSSYDVLGICRNLIYSHWQIPWIPHIDQHCVLIQCIWFFLWVPFLWLSRLQKITNMYLLSSRIRFNDMEGEANDAFLIVASFHLYLSLYLLS